MNINHSLHGTMTSHNPFTHEDNDTYAHENATNSLHRVASGPGISGNLEKSGWKIKEINKW